MQSKPAMVTSLYEASATNGGDAPRAARAYERIAEQIGEQIRSGQLVRGQKLPTEKELGERFGVGRGVVREAVKMLDALGLVETRQGSGIYVRTNPITAISRGLTLSVTPEEQSIAALFEFRTILEASAAEFAALRRTDAQAAMIERIAAATAEAARCGATDVWHGLDQQFHNAVSEASGNPYLGVAISAVREMQRGVTMLVRAMRGSTPAAAQHCAIAAAITARRPDEAVAQMRGHLLYTANRWQEARETARHAGRR